MDDWQEQIIIGTILGGSSLVKPPGGKNFYLSMRDKNYLWISYKVAELAFLYTGKSPVKYGISYRCDSRCHEDLLSVRNKLYQGNTRVIFQQTLDLLRDIGLAVWFLDNGGKTGRNKKNAYFNTTKYEDFGTNLIKSYFLSLGFDCEIHVNKRRRRILFSVDSTIRLFKVIAHRFPEFMEYRL